MARMQYTSGISAGLAAEPRMKSEREGARAIRMNRTATLAAEVGLLGTFAIAIAFASFGPSFTYSLGLALFATATGLGIAAVALAHRATHAHRRDPHLTGHQYATIGSLTGWIAILVGTSYIGLLYLFLHPVSWFVWVPLAALALALHRDSRAKEASFLRSLDRQTDTANCGRCGGRIALDAGRWVLDDWLCQDCAESPWGEYA